MKIGRILRCVFSSDLFHLNSERTLRSLEGNYVNISCAVDILLMADTERELKELLDFVVKESNEDKMSLTARRKNALLSVKDIA